MSQCEIVSKVVQFKVRCPVCSGVIEIEEVWVNTTTQVEEYCSGCDVELKLAVHVNLDVERKE